MLLNYLYSISHILSPMTTFETFKKSIYDPAFYRTVASEPLGSIFRYYAKATLVLSIMMTIGLGVFLGPAIVSFVKRGAPELVNSYYPAGLVVTIEKGEATINMPEPYIINGKGDTLVALKEQGLENIFVIDTEHNFEKVKFDEYKTIALLTKTEIVTRSDNGQITIQELRMVPKTAISQEILLSWVEKVRAKLAYIILGGALVTFIVIALGYFVYLIPLILFALIPFFIAWLKKTPLSYGGAYKMSLYAIVPALALKTLLNLFGIFFLPSYFTLLVFMLIIALNMREVEAPTLFENK